MVMIGLDDAVGTAGVLEATLEHAKSWPAPMFNPWLPAYVRLGRLGREHGVDAFVTGGGGDEWLCVSPYLAADLMASFDLLGLYRLVSGARRSHRMSTGLILKCYLWTCGVRALGRRALNMAPSLLDRRDRRVLAQNTQPWLAPDPDLRRAIDGRWTPKGAPKSYYLRDLREGLDASLIAQELEEFFELGRRIGTPVVRPFLDPDVIGLLARVPPEVLNHGGRTKALVRQTLDRRFPELAFGQQRKVQAIPTLERVLRDPVRRPVGLGRPADRPGRARRGRFDQVGGGRCLRPGRAVWIALAPLHATVAGGVHPCAALIRRPKRIEAVS